MHDSNRREKSCFGNQTVSSNHSFSGEMTSFKADGCEEKYHHVFSEKEVIGGGIFLRNRITLKYNSTI